MQASTARLLGLSPEPSPLRDAFLRWQCRVRQMMMRDKMGRPDEAVMPALTLQGEAEPMGHIITVLSKGPAHSKTPEMRHMAQRTNDPASTREAALKILQRILLPEGGRVQRHPDGDLPARQHRCRHDPPRRTLHADLRCVQPAL